MGGQENGEEERGVWVGWSVGWVGWAGWGGSLFHDVTVRYSLNRTGPHGCRVYSSMKRHSFVNDFPLLLSCRLCCAIVEVFPHLTLQVCCAYVLMLDVCHAGPS